ncbi:MAG: vitamin K epoxide reductase family protein [Anaerolineae bacterium]|nr:vitamin K epoxide reductase family protein [Anaerolineae bacterium]
MRSRKWFWALVLITLFTVQMGHAQQAGVVYGVFFYSPTCRHCEQVIQNDWPTIRAEFGDSLRVMFINVTTPDGSALLQAARSALQIEANGVPMLIIGSEVFVGSFDIPARAPDVIRAGLAAGGIGFPAVPGIETRYAEALQPAADAVPASSPPATLSLLDRLAADPIANALALVILGLLIVSLALTLTRQKTLIQQFRRPTFIALTLLGLGISISLLAGSTGELPVMAAAAGILGVFTLLLGLEFWRRTPLTQRFDWRVPLIALAGLGVATYLASIELTQAEAVCGLVGNCNLVQQSPYARLLGIPIGVIGIGGYVAILLLWGVGSAFGQPARTNGLLRAAALFGVGFSTYLTFLEPFVIGATCLWCLSSALIMLLLLWLLTDTPTPKRVLGQASA